MDRLRLLKAAEVAVMLNLGTLTVVKRARAGKIPGALLTKAPRGGALGYAYFRADVIRAWLDAGCPLAEPLEKPPVFTIARHGARTHAVRRVQNDATGKPQPERQVERALRSGRPPTVFEVTKAAEAVAALMDAAHRVRVTEETL